MRKNISIAITFLFAAVFFPCTLCGQEKPAHPRRVMTWVPYYAAEASLKRLNESYDGLSMKDGVTHIGLQFWLPTEDGDVKLHMGNSKADGAETISRFRKWGADHGVKVLLCVHNATADGWDWKLARKAFDTHRSKFIDALVNETKMLGLDGVDIDLEGTGNLEDSKKAYILFIKELSERLHAEGKELTLDTFAYKWNAPNQTWWAELLPHLDGLHVMGYKETGSGATGWRSYNFIKAAAGQNASKLLIGVPSHIATWQNKDLTHHLAWFVKDDAVGLAIWDAQLKDPVWRTKKTWQAIASIKGIAKKGDSPIGTE